jgi:hypothetical protein
MRTRTFLSAEDYLYNFTKRVSENLF